MFILLSEWACASIVFVSTLYVDVRQDSFVGWSCKGWCTRSRDLGLLHYPGASHTLDQHIWVNQQSDCLHWEGCLHGRGVAVGPTTGPHPLRRVGDPGGYGKMYANTMIDLCWVRHWGVTRLRPEWQGLSAQIRRLAVVLWHKDKWKWFSLNTHMTSICIRVCVIVGWITDMAIVDAIILTCTCSIFLWTDYKIYCINIQAIAWINLLH